MQFDARPLVLHVMYRFDTGGLENGVVNLINHMPREAYRHAVMALTEVTDFRKRIQRDDVEFIALNKPPGHGIWLYPQLYRLFRRLRPAIVHSRNLAALEVQVPAWAAGVPVRIHGEHGRDLNDLDGSSVRYQRVRRVYKPFVRHYVALSRDLAEYLNLKVLIPVDRISQIYNGVDTVRFAPVSGSAKSIPGYPFNPVQHWVVGTVGRMDAIKDQTMLARAFVLAVASAPDLKSRLRLVIVGDGRLRVEVQAILEAAGISDLAWLPGERSDVPEILRAMNCFVLPSLSEGISNAILEAMASGLPVIATRVGGNADLVADGETGVIVPAADPLALAQCIVQLASSPELARSMGEAGRQRVKRHFSMEAMVAGYQSIYDEQLRLSRHSQEGH